MGYSFGMSLRDEINSAPWGTKADLIRKTGFSKMTIIRATAGLQCCAATAQEIAEAFGAPDRWPELVVVRRRRPPQMAPPVEAEGIPAAS